MCVAKAQAMLDTAKSAKSRMSLKSMAADVLADSQGISSNGVDLFLHTYKVKSQHQTFLHFITVTS